MNIPPRYWSDRLLCDFSCYSVNRYKPLQNQLLRTPLQTVTNSYKPLQTSYSVNRYKPLQTVKNRYKPLQTIYALNRYKPLHYKSDTTDSRYTVTAQSSNDR